MKKIFLFFRKFFHDKKDTLLFAGLSVLPFLGFIRIILKHSYQYPIVSYLILFIFFAQLFIYYLIFFEKNFTRQIILFFIYLCNQKIVQDFLLIALLMEEIIFTHFLFIMLFWGSVGILYTSASLSGNLAWQLLSNILLTLFLLYFRIRRTLLNRNAFIAAGFAANTEGGLSWEMILGGLNLVVKEKLAGLDGPLLSGGGSRASFVGPGGPPASAPQSTTSPPNVGPLLPQSSIGPLISNKVPAARSFVFPFCFPPRSLLKSGLKSRLGESRSMTTGSGSAARRLASIAKEGAEQIPAQSWSAIIAALSTTVGGLYLLGRDIQNSAQKEKHHQEQMKMQERALDQDRDKLEQRKKEFDFQQDLEHRKLKVEEGRLDLEREKLKMAHPHHQGQLSSEKEAQPQFYTAPRQEAEGGANHFPPQHPLPTGVAGQAQGGASNVPGASAFSGTDIPFDSSTLIKKIILAFFD